MVKCFLPKSRASIDQAPGPMIAWVAPSIASRMGTRASPVCTQAIQPSATAITVPLTGVHNPMSRNIPAPAAIKSGTTSAVVDEPRWMAAQNNSAAAVDNALVIATR